MSSVSRLPQKSSRPLNNLQDSEGYTGAGIGTDTILGRSRGAKSNSSIKQTDNNHTMGSRGKARAQIADGEEQVIWNESRDPINMLLEIEKKSGELREQIINKEKTMSAKEKAGTKPSIDDIDSLSALYREMVKLGETSKSLGIPDLVTKVMILKGLTDHNDEKKGQPSNSRTSKSRESQSAMDLDGPSDSPVPSPAENKHIRKGMGTSRTSSLPPREKDVKDEKEEKETYSSGRTKVTFAVNAEVAFKPKPPNPQIETDWIQGVVFKVIGEGKSRRYDVQDPYPDHPVAEGEIVIHRSSASSMVPIPPEGANLQDYEVGKRVLALYPATSTFYHADVVEMLDNGKKVLVVFEEEELKLAKEVPRRFVLDHKG